MRYNVAMGLICPWNVALAAEPSAFPIAMGLAGGLALFLLGMQELTRAMEFAGSGGLRRLVERFTRSRARAAWTGAVATAFLQSSSLATVLVVGFVSAGLVGLSQSLAFVLGANVGTTVTAQLVAFRIADYGLVAAAIGFALTLATGKERVRAAGMALLGLGLIFHGLELMGDATAPLADSDTFARLLRHLGSPLLAVLAGAGFTALVQSSSACTGLVIVFASQGLIGLELGIALIIGSNVGTCVTALLAGLRANAAGKRAALGHFFFNTAGAALWIGFVDDFARVLEGGNGRPPLVDGVDTARWIAHAHTLFNGLNLVVFLPFVGLVATLLQRIVPERRGARSAGEPLHLEPALLVAPKTALAAAVREIARLGDLAAEAIERGLAAATQGTRADLEDALAREADLDRLHAAIVAYLGRVAAKARSTPETTEVAQLLDLANVIESIGDTLERHIVPLGHDRIERGVTLSSATRGLLEPLAQDVHAALRGALGALVRNDAAGALAVRQMKTGFRDRSGSVRLHLAQRLAADAPLRVETFRIESELVEQMRRTFDLARRLARGVLERLEASQGGPAP